jgi:hypothetical protein
MLRLGKGGARLAATLQKSSVWTLHLFGQVCRQFLKLLFPAGDDNIIRSKEWEMAGLT